MSTNHPLNRIFMFDEEKTIEVILYLAHKLEARSECMRISKLMYFADKTHLEDLGRTITLDSYVARYHGNTGNHTLKLLMGEFLRPDGAYDIKYGRIIPLRLANIDFMSESDIKVIDDTIKIYGSFPNWHLIMLSRDYAWVSATSANTKYSNTDKYGPYQSVDMLDIINEVDDIEGLLREYLEDTGHF